MKPKKQHTKSRSRKRRSVIKLKSPRVSVCSKCKHPVKPHTACDFCGMYKDKEVLKIKLNKKEKKKRQEEEKESKKKK